MATNAAVEVRVELYVDGGLSEGVSTGITALLSQRWPDVWDVKIPARPSLDHPAEWHAVVPLLEGTTQESLHALLAKEILALDTSHSFHLRTRWSFQETPNHQEVYEEGWGSRRP